MTVTSGENIEFHSSPSQSLGMELELQLLDPQTWGLVDGILPLLTQYPAHPGIKPEYNQAMVEVVSGVCQTIPELAADMRATLKTLQARAQEVGLSLCAAGTHPFNQRLAQVTPLARYCRQHEAGGYLSKLMMTFALHIHVGMPSGDTAMRIMTQLRPYLPIFLALSASSPFWQGHFTAYASFRQRFLAMMRSYGICPSFRNWQAFTEFLGLAKTSGMFESTRDVHWDLRPNSGFGTLEVRVMDAQPTLRECILLAALVHSLVVHLLHADEEEVGFSLRPQPWLIEKENHFRASRYGLDAAYIESGTGGSRPIRAIVEDMLVELAPTAAELQETPYLCDLQRHLHTGPSYLRQQQVFQAVGSLQGVTVALVEELAADLASGQDPLGAWLDGSAGRDQKVDATMTL